MRSKASLVLIEQLMMVLVFSLAAVLCLQAFVQADRISRESEEQDRAVVQARNAAEVLKHCRGDYEEAAALYGGSWSGEHWIITYDDLWEVNWEEEAYQLQVKPLSSEDELLGRAEVTVCAADGTQLCILPVAWQEVSDHD